MWKYSEELSRKELQEVLLANLMTACLSLARERFLFFGIHVVDLIYLEVGMDANIVMRIILDQSGYKSANGFNMRCVNRSRPLMYDVIIDPAADGVMNDESHKRL